MHTCVCRKPVLESVRRREEQAVATEQTLCLTLVKTEIGTSPTFLRDVQHLCYLMRAKMMMHVELVVGTVVAWLGFRLYYCYTSSSSMLVLFTIDLSPDHRLDDLALSLTRTIHRT